MSRCQPVATTAPGGRRQLPELAAILDAGRELFVEQGYAATTMGDVAARAEVAPATANAAFGGKAGLLKQLVDVGIAGDDEDIPVSERDVAMQIVG